MRIFRAWVEIWDTRKIGTNGDAIFEARIVRKYVSLKWLDPENEYIIRVAHPNGMNFHKHQGNNNYNISAKIQVYDLNIPHDSQSDLYDFWVTNTDFCEQVIDYLQ